MVKENLENIQKYIDRKNFTKIREIAHSLKGASANLGLNTMFDSTLNLENFAKEEHIE